MNKKILYIFMVILWMALVFFFSHQQAKVSSATSGNTIRMIIDLFSNIRNIEENEKEQIVTKLQTIVRKLAHFSIYTLGGMLIYNFINTYDLDNKRKMIYSFIIGGFYAVTDEFHQLFIEGRSGELRDICIDSSGILFGILLILLLNKIKKHFFLIKNKIFYQETCKK